MTSTKGMKEVTMTDHQDTRTADLFGAATAPHRKARRTNSATSKLAAQRVPEVAASHHPQILAALKRAGRRGMSVYICGPMSGLPDLNYPAFHAAAADLRASGWVVINPAENPEPCPDPTWDDWMRISLDQVRASSLLALLPGWERSRGALLEVETARELGIPAFALKDVLSGEAG